VSGQGTGTVEHPGMTLRVYRVSESGERTEVRPLTAVEPGEPETIRGYPPCTCPRCRRR
jgi:hypothetical protein